MDTCDLETLERLYRLTWDLVILTVDENQNQNQNLNPEHRESRMNVVVLQ